MIRVVTLVSFMVLVSCGFAQDSELPMPSIDRAVIYYFGFEIDRITGIPEDQIQDYGCLYDADKEDIISSLTTYHDSNEKYDQFDVRAKILIDNDIYFVDYKGVVKKDNNLFKIDKDKFVRSLILVGDCK